MPGGHFSNREGVLLCRASVLDAKRELYMPDVRVLFMPDEPFTYWASATHTRRPLFLLGGRFTYREGVFFYAGERFRCGAAALTTNTCRTAVCCRAGVIYSGQALYIPGECFTCQVASERAIFIPGEYFKYRSSGLHGGLALYLLNPVNDGLKNWYYYRYYLLESCSST